MCPSLARSRLRRPGYAAAVVALGTPSQAAMAPRRLPVVATLATVAAEQALVVGTAVRVGMAVAEVLDMATTDMGAIKPLRLVCTVATPAVVVVVVG